MCDRNIRRPSSLLWGRSSLRKKMLDVMRLTVVAASCWFAIPTTRVLADNTDTCVARMSSYVIELDELFSFSTWIEAFGKLNSRYFPFMDCDTDSLLVETTKSRFFRGITYYPRSKRYVVGFASKAIEVGFAYRADQRRSENHNVAQVGQ